MTKDRQEEIIQLAEKLAQEFNPEHLSNFPFKNITKQKSDIILLYSEKLPVGISAATDFLDEENKYYIVVNKNLPEVDQYFISAHALAHYFLHQEEIKEEYIVDKINLFDANGPQSRISKNEFELELEANHFAMVMLMPSTYLRNAWEKLHDVDDCAQVFNVPIDVMASRLRMLGLL